MVIVEDDGVGLAESVRAGIGLNSMRGASTELGGALRIERTPGGGTIVERAPPGPAMSASRPDRRRPPALSAGAARSADSDVGHRGRGRGDGRDRGGRLSVELEPDVVLMDLQMPELSGHRGDQADP